MNERETSTIRIVNKETNLWDFLISFGSGIVNLIKIEKIICIVILYLLGRDFYFTKNIDKGEFYQKNIVSSGDLIKLILESDSKDIIYITIICILFITILILIIVIRCVYVREINRLARDRRRLMHDVEIGNFRPLKNHHSSEGGEPL